LKISSNKFEDEASMISLLNNASITDETKSAIIISQETKIGDINAVSNTLWDALIANSGVVASWVNVLSYYELKENFTEELVVFLNNTDNYTDLGKTVIDNPDDEESFCRGLIHLSEISDDSFASLVKSIPLSYDHSLNFKGLSSKKVEVLLDNSKLELTASNFDELKRLFSPRHIVLIEQNLTNFIKEHESYDLDASDYVALLKSAKLTNESMESVIAMIPASEITASKELASLMFLFVKNKGSVSLNFEFFVAILSNLSSQIEKIQWLNLTIDERSTDETIQILKLIGEPYSTILQDKGTRPKLQYNVDNINLVESLKVKKIISRFKYDESVIQIYLKRK
jgi:hypothetical protein